MEITTFVSKSPQQTEQFAEQFAKSLPTGAILALMGDLGAGKTTFTRGLARGLGITDPVTSPTYTIVNEYRDQQDKLRFVHMDLYRLQHADELIDLGWDDYLDSDAVIAVEWSERAERLFRGAMQVSIETIDEQTRQIVIAGLV